MALKVPKPIPFWKAVGVCFLALVSPDRFEAFEKQFDADLNERDDLKFDRRIDPVRLAYKEAAIWLLVASVTGLFLGLVSGALVDRTATISAVYAILGAALILWATLAHQGWTIQSYSDATLTERVNRWLFRGLLSVGTALLVCAAILQLL